MDKNTISHYGWIIVTATVISLLIVFATPFGKYMVDNATIIVKGFLDTSNETVDEEHLAELEKGWEDKLLTTPKDGKIPSGGVYIVYSSGETLEEGMSFPEPKMGDIYRYGDYEYCYGYGYDAEDIEWVYSTSDWGVRVLDVEKESYEKMLREICGKPITSAKFAFHKCEQMKTTPYLPDTITDCEEAFSLCSNLITITNIPNNTRNLAYFTYACESLSKINKLPVSVEYATNAFNECTSLNGSIEMPCHLKEFNLTFKNCNAEIKYYHYDGCDCAGMPVPENGTYIEQDGTKYTTGDNMPLNPKTGDTYVYGDYTYVYNATYNPSTNKWVEDKSIMGWGVRVNDTDKILYKSILSEIGGAKVRSIKNAFIGCTKVQEVPSIPNTVIYIDNAFDGCKTMTENIVLPCRFDGVINSFKNCYVAVDYKCPEKCRHNSAGEVLEENAFYIKNYKYDHSMDAWKCDDIYVRNDLMPTAVSLNDYYNDGVYEYYYGYSWCEDKILSVLDGCNYATTGWSVHFIANTTNPEAPRNTIANGNITSLKYAYAYTNLTVVPAIPSTVTDMEGAYEASNLNNAQNIAIPSGVKSLQRTFSRCVNLQYGPDDIPSTITNLNYTFSGCKSLKQTPYLLEMKNIKEMTRTFESCTSLTNIPEIPISVESLKYTFANCTSLSYIKGNIFGNNIKNIEGIFSGCKNIYNYANNPLMIPDSITNADYCFNNITRNVYISNGNDNNSINIMSKMVSDNPNVRLTINKTDISAKIQYIAPGNELDANQIVSAGWSCYKFKPAKTGSYIIGNLYGGHSYYVGKCQCGNYSNIKDLGSETINFLQDNGIYDGYGIILTNQDGAWSKVAYDDDNGGFTEYSVGTDTQHILCPSCSDYARLEIYEEGYSFAIDAYLNANQDYYIYIMPFDSTYTLKYTDIIYIEFVE